MRKLFFFFVGFCFGIIFVFATTRYALIRERRSIGMIKGAFGLDRQAQDNDDYAGILFRRRNLNSRINSVPVCSWARGEPLYLPDEDDEVEQGMITWLNEWNVSYTLSDGSLIGAYRHRGKIPDDFDLDIKLLSWHNLDCGLVSKPGCDYGAKNARGVIRDKFMAAFQARINETSAPYYLSREPWGFRLWKKNKNFRADVSVAFPDSRSFMEPSCRCWYRLIPALCYERVFEYLTRRYHETPESLMIPNIPKGSSRNNVVDRSRPNPRHERWKQKNITNTESSVSKS